MPEHQNKDDTTPLEYFIAGLVVLLFGLLYFFINHGMGFQSDTDDRIAGLPVAPIPAATSSKLLADIDNEAEMPSTADPVENPEPETANDEEKQLAENAADSSLEAEEESAEREKVEQERLAAEKALRDQLAAERQRADDTQRQLEETQKLLAAAQANNAEQSTMQTVVDTNESNMPEESAQAVMPQETVADAPATTEKPQAFKLPDGTEVPVADDGFEGVVKAAMSKSGEANTTLLNEPMLFDDIWFESGSSRLSDSSQAQIKVVAALMNTYQDRRVLIRGHTDNVGGVNTNSLLSLTRSDSMKKQLVGLGIDQNRIKIEGVGQLEPIAPNETAEGRSRNRRIELILIE